MAERRAKVEFDVLEGYIWPTGAKFLESWSKEMWRHRTNLRNKDTYPGQIARENAEGTVKLAANNMMGRLAHPGGELYKPDWNLEIVHKAIANQMYSFKSWLDKAGVRPALVCTDSFWIISDEYDESMAIPGILEYMDEQRGYHHIGSCELTHPIIDLFELASPEAINNFLKQEITGHVESV